MKVQYALCGNADEIVHASFDLIELWASRTFPAEKPALHPDLECRSTNGFFTGEYSIYTEPERAITYGIQLAQNAVRNGVRTMVIGSGGARQAPERMSPHTALSEFLAIVRDIQQAVPNVVLAPEPLNARECNVGNDYRDLATKCRDAGIGVCVDTYHVFCAIPDGVNWSEQLEFAPSHVHIANRDRHVPAANDPELQSFFERLFQLGYSGIVSYEGSRPADALAIRQLAESAGYR